MLQHVEASRADVASMLQHVEASRGHADTSAISMVDLHTPVPVISQPSVELKNRASLTTVAPPIFLQRNRRF